MSDAPDEVLHVADSVDEFVERTRHEQIHEAKQRAADAIERAALRKTQLRRDGVSEPEARELARETARAGVERYVLEVEAIYKRTDPGRKLWLDADLGEMSVRGALEWDEDPGEVNHITVHPGAGMEVRSDRVALAGVRAYVEGFGVATVEAEAEVSVSTSPNPAATETETLTTQLTPPVRISREVYRCTNALLAEADVGITLEDDTGAVEGGDYADLLDEYDSS